VKDIPSLLVRNEIHRVATVSFSADTEDTGRISVFTGYASASLRHPALPAAQGNVSSVSVSSPRNVLGMARNHLGCLGTSRIIYFPLFWGFYKVVLAQSFNSFLLYYIRMYVLKLQLDQGRH
jgi:hypothetical protein